MRLSEAIRLGSLAIQNPHSHDTRYCAIGMGLECIGKRSMGRDGSNPDIANYRELRSAWPWTTIRETPGHAGYYIRIAWMFDDNVCPVSAKPTMTLEALCDQVRKWEEELSAKGINVEQVSMAAELNQPASMNICAKCGEHKNDLAHQSKLIYENRGHYFEPQVSELEAVK